MAVRLLIVCLVCLACIERLAASELALAPALSVIEVNFPTNLSCKLATANFFPLIANSSVNFQWRLPGGIALVNGQSLNNRISAVSENSNQSTLVVTRAQVNDSGSIECVLIKNTTNGVIVVVANATAEFKVYVLSSYFVEGMIVLSVNCVLFVIFLVCSVRQCCVGRRKDDVYRKYNGHFLNQPGHAIDRSNLMDSGLSQEESG